MRSVVLAQCANFRADIVMVIDSSGSIRDNNPQDGSYDNWNLLLQFVERIIDDLYIETGQVRIGAVRFSTNAQNVFYLKEFATSLDKNALKNKIRNMGYLGGHTNTAAAINIMHHEQFRRENGDRPDVQNIAIIITDGNSTVNKQNTIPYAEAARKANIQVYTVGVTKGIKISEVIGMSSLPQQLNHNYYLAKDFRTLNAEADKLVLTMCKVLGKYVL